MAKSQVRIQVKEREVRFPTLDFVKDGASKQIAAAVIRRPAAWRVLWRASRL